MILCEKAVGNSNVWKSFSHISYEALRKSWQYSILKLMLQHIPNPSFKSLLDQLYENNESGFYVYATPIKNFNAGVINYITRYAGRGVANFRANELSRKKKGFNIVPAVALNFGAERKKGLRTLNAPPHTRLFEPSL